MPSPRPLQAVAHLVFLLAVLATAWALPSAAHADAAGSPAGPSAVGAYLDMGSTHGCALQRDHLVRCWGAGSSGRLGGGQLDARLNSPGSADATAVAIGQASAVSAGDSHTCVVAAAGTVRCWGQGSAGQLGTGNRDNRGDGYADPLSGTDEPSTVPLGAPASAISAGGDFTCALTTAGAVRCWGDGHHGVLGSRGTDGRLNGLPDGPTDEASTVPLGAAATAISAGQQHACTLLAGGAVRCWGLGANGRLGTGATDDRLDGVAAGGTDEASIVDLGEPATAISAGGAHTCALLASGAVRCWGANGSGQLGAGRTDARLDGVISGSGASATDAATLVPLKPVNTAANRLTTTPSVRAIAITTGEAHTCAIVEGGDVRCWGYGDQGRLGHGAIDNRLDNNVAAIADIATRVGGGPTATTGPGLGMPAISITASYTATCAELANGAVRCWGSGQDGQLGSRATDARLDGVVDLVTGTDAPSTVPIAALPSLFGDLVGDPSPPAPAAGAVPAPTAAGAAPTPAAGQTPSSATATPELSFRVVVKGRKATVAALLRSTRRGTCPRTVTAKVKEGRSVIGSAKLKTSRKGDGCRAAGTIKLRRSAKKGKTVTVHVSGKGVAGRSLAPTK